MLSGANQNSTKTTRALHLDIDFTLEIEDLRIRTLFLKSLKTSVLRVAWACLLYNVIICVQLVCHIGLDFFSVGNLVVLCLTNGCAITATVLSYKQVRFMHWIGPCIMLT